MSDVMTANRRSFLAEDGKETIVRTDDLVRDFDLGHRPEGGRLVLRAVDKVSLTIRRGETLGLVGESGSGKSTIGRMLVGLLPYTSGNIELFGQKIEPRAKAAAWKPLRRRVQFVFQDPHAALNPRMRVGTAIAEPLDVAGNLTRKERSARVDELMELVGLPTSFARRFPHEFSGGQRQRIVIARALALNPEILVCDEAVASLDVSMQAQIVNLLKDLQDQLGLSYLFIAHDLAVVRAVSHRVPCFMQDRLLKLVREPPFIATRCIPIAARSSIPCRVHAAARRVPLLQERCPACSTSLKAVLSVLAARKPWIYVGTFRHLCA
ncbi:hypothetical protein IY71_16445 [Brucella suis]|uniref:ABC transporter domain-containing protein n=1 Tax=Brucella suis TaxID=29461 RepID=A0AAU8REU5_BRUSS|nr:hypothetical protein IY71_07855 [Brucella suis]ALY32405.1 hypothetical protein AWH03_10185 [Brucella suis 019]ENR18829.1 hypothetical protein C062_03106 [Brucella suis 92/29]ENR27534.1 hypothetical protein C965_03107 [Brucella suis CNGB 786]ENT25831.1 hypothetical protein B985_02934 [Brucella suis 01-5744]ENT32587.1 hypothetical protein C966_03101 [Brucella suis CNGB 247]KDV06661.1 hypothetical protein BF16_06035 [Brucella suis 1330]